MDAGAKRILESVTQETLHAHQFSRSSTQATYVLTDLLSRYLALLSSTCAKYAEHAGRHHLNARDAVTALTDLGVDVEELSEYHATEGREMSRYAVHSQRRKEDLLEFNAAYSVGLREDREDFIPLVYAPVTDGLSSEDEEDEGEVSAAMNMAEGSEGTASPKWSTQEVIEVDDYEDVAKEALSERLDEPEPVPPRHATPPLPLSPISNPATPPRKRQRTAKWSPPPHIPAFLPPFPTDTPRPTPTPPPQELPTSFPVSPLKVERPTSPIPELSPSSSSADYLTPTPYTLSSLSNQVVWHPPTKPSSPPMPTGRLPLPQVQPALFGAYHHVLTHPPPPQVTSINPGRYKVALALLSQADTSPRWDPPPTLFANTTPNAPRVAPMPPSHAIPIGHNPPGKESKEGKDKDKAKESEVDPKLPTAFPRPVGAIERVAPLLSQQSTRIPGLARLLLPNSVHTRTTRLGHPPVLSRGAQKLTYGPGVNAIWNSGPTIASTPAPLPGGKPPKEADGKDGQLQKVLVDARMYATWNYEEKHYKEPLVVGRRARMGSLQIGVGGVSNGIAVGGVGLARARSQSKG